MGNRDCAYLRGKRRRLCNGTEKLFRFFPLNIFNFLIIEKPHSRTAPDDPIPIMLYPTHESASSHQFKTPPGVLLTSFLATGFSNNERCVNLPNFASTSKSANSAKLFVVSIKVVRFGIEFAIDGCRLLTRFRASSRVRRRGE